MQNFAHTITFHHTIWIQYKQQHCHSSSHMDLRGTSTYMRLHEPTSVTTLWAMVWLTLISSAQIKSAPSRPHHAGRSKPWLNTTAMFTKVNHPVHKHTTQRTWAGADDNECAADLRRSETAHKATRVQENFWVQWKFNNKQATRSPLLTTQLFLVKLHNQPRPYRKHESCW